jgi:glycosyltransferase involved in cell wall biosynthesis
MNSNSLIYIAPSRSTFILQDIEFLSRKVTVFEYFFKTQSKWMIPFEMIRLFFFLLFSKQKIYLVSFGGYHSFVATLTAKLKRGKCYIILNGTDCAALPQVNYGHLRGGMLKFCCLKSYKWSSKLFPVSKFLLETKLDFEMPNSISAGLINFNIDLNKAVVIPNGFDASFWRKVSEKERKTVLTVAGKNGWILKGINHYIQLAKWNPDYTFKIAGPICITDYPSNVQLLGQLNKEELRRVYSASEFYFQLSVWEGFGCALSEAMLCECIPIVSSVNALPEIVGDKSNVISHLSQEDIRHKMEELVFKNPQDYRRRIAKEYSIDSRIKLLLEQMPID